MTQPVAVVLDACPLDQKDMSWKPLRELVSLTLHDHTTPAQLTGRIQQAQIVLTNKVRLSAVHLEQAPGLKFISVLATGYDCVDTAAARARGIIVSNIPHYSTASTAQTTIALMLEITQAVGLHDRSVHDGEWVKSPSYSFWKKPLIELEGKTLVIIGLGAIGSRVAQIACAMGMHIVIAVLPGRPAKSCCPYECVPLDEALARADFVSLHCPLNVQTAKIINARSISLMKPEACLINTARGGLIDEDALAKALHNGTLAGAALDVLGSEPPLPVNPLLQAPRCLITPHISWATLEARRKLLEMTAANIRAFLEGHPIHVIN